MDNLEKLAAKFRDLETDLQEMDRAVDESWEVKDKPDDLVRLLFILRNMTTDMKRYMSWAAPEVFELECSLGLFDDDQQVEK